MYEKAMPIAMEASGGSLALFMVSTISPVGVALVIRSEEDKPYGACKTAGNGSDRYRALISGEEVSEHPLSLQRRGKGEIQYKEQEKRQYQRLCNAPNLLGGISAGPVENIDQGHHHHGNYT